MQETLKERIARHIHMTGPLPLAEFMHWCLFDAEQGYYTTQPALGRNGDFVTAPEISQMFGEMIGIWLIQSWQTLGEPEAFNLVELGPGKGTLMRDILRTCRLEPRFLEAARTWLVETSDALVSQQREAIKHQRNINWAKSLDAVPDGVTLIVANEFLDALPFRQYVKTGQGWHERCVCLDSQGNLEWGAGAGKLEETALPSGHDAEPQGSVFEISTIRETFVERIASRVASDGGAALLIDYGHANSGFGETFQAVSQHRYTDPLDAPGKADLTSHVDFEPLAKIVEASGCNLMPIETQGAFLLAAGLLERAGNLGHDKPEAEQERIKREAERLALPGEMGDLFKVFAFSSGPALWPFDKTA